MEFYNINYLFFSFLGIVAFFILYMGEKRKNYVRTILNLKTSKKIYKHLISLAFILIGISLSAPRILKNNEKIEVLGTDIYALIDVSATMNANDVLPRRIEKAKYELENIIKNLNGDRIGIIPFSTNAYIQMPLSDDYNMALMYLDVVDTDLLVNGKTNIDYALNIAQEALLKSSSKEKIILILSDGNFEDSKFNVDNNIIVHSIGIGTIDGTLINTSKGFAKDTEGNIISTKLNKTKLMDISANSKFYESNNLKNSYASFLNKLQNVKKSSTRLEEIKTYKEFFQYFLLIAFFIIIITYYLEERRS